MRKQNLSVRPEVSKGRHQASKGFDTSARTAGCVSSQQPQSIHHGGAEDAESRREELVFLRGSPRSPRLRGEGIRHLTREQQPPVRPEVSKGRRQASKGFDTSARTDAGCAPQTEFQFIHRASAVKVFGIPLLAALHASQKSHFAMDL
jgi:hypothetical protein